MRTLTHTFKIAGSDADDVRALLDARAHHGVIYTEKRNRWLDWIIPVAFTVTAPPGVMESLKKQVEELDAESWRERQF